MRPSEHLGLLTRLILGRFIELQGLKHTQFLPTAPGWLHLLSPQARVADPHWVRGCCCFRGLYHDASWLVVRTRHLHEERFNCMLTRPWCVCKSFLTVLLVQISMVDHNGSKMEVLGLPSTRLGRVFDLYCERRGYAAKTLGSFPMETEFKTQRRLKVSPF